MIIFYMGVIIDFIVRSCVKSSVEVLYYFEHLTFTNVHIKSSFFQEGSTLLP